MLSRLWLSMFNWQVLVITTHFKWNVLRNLRRELIACRRVCRCRCKCKCRSRCGWAGVMPDDVTFVTFGHIKMLSEKWTKKIRPKIAKDRGSRNSWDNNRYFIAQATKWSRRWLFPSDSCSSFRICKLHNGKLDGRNLYLKRAEFFSQRTMQYYRNIMLSPPDKRKLTELWTKLEKKIGLWDQASQNSGIGPFWEL